MDINDNFYFDLKKQINIRDTQKGLKLYHDNFNNAFSLKGTYPIFLDTNILLNYYGMSHKDKQSLKKFFDDNKKKIVITNQIEKEFLRNRLSVIQEFFDELNKIKKNFEKELQEDIKNKFKNTRENKILIKDFPELLTEINGIYEELEKKLFSNENLKNSINEKIDKILKENEYLEFTDAILEIYQEFNQTDELNDVEKKFLENKYFELLSNYKTEKESVRWKFAFPGCGEKKEKEPFGDFFIIHEIMKYMKTNNTDAVFLTRDIKKADWIKEERKPFIHYIEKIFQCTGKILYIFDATDLLQKISFENIYTTVELPKQMKYKGLILDTNWTYDEEGVWYMLENNRASIWGDAQNQIHSIKEFDYVFLSQKHQGIIAAGQAISNPKSNEEDQESYVDVEWITKIPSRETGIQKYIPFSSVTKLLEHGFYWSRTLKTPYLSMEECELLIDELKRITN